MMVALLTAVTCFAQPPASGAALDREAELLTRTRQLTFEGRRAGEGYFSADGRRLIFQSERSADNPFYQIYLLDLETGDIERVSPGHGKTTCAWVHPSGTKALFASTHEDPAARDKQRAELDFRASGKERRYSWDYDETYDLFERDLQTGALRQLTRERGYDAEGSWSPDGRWIAFASNRAAYVDALSAEDSEAFQRDLALFMDIYIMDTRDGTTRRLTTARGYDGGPFFSPDGRRICWRRFSENGATAEIFTMNIDGTDERQLTSLGAMSWAPFFHPSGDYLVFTTNRHGFDNFELYLVDAHGAAEPVRVTTTPGFDGLASFSPDGRRLTWTSTRTADKTSQIFLADWDHAKAAALLRAAVRPGAAAVAAPPTTSPTITASDARQYVEVLASERMAGRRTGTAGERMATAYVADQFKRLGLVPAGDDGTYFQPFPFTAGVELGAGNALRLSSADAGALQVDRDWRPLSFSSAAGTTTAPIAFAGYGLVAPKHDRYAEYDSYVHLDVTDKWVMVLRYLPENIEPGQRQYWSRYAGLRHKAMIARDKGAKGLIVVSGPNARVREQLVPLSHGGTSAGGRMAAISLSNETAARVLKAGGQDLKALQNALDGGEPQMGIALPDNLTLTADINLRRIREEGRNVLGRLVANGERLDERAIVVGAHVDHLGVGRGSGSLARDDEVSGIHYGADDNASGVAGMIEIAEYLVSEVRAGRLQLRRDVVFAAWSGEEIGLLGSQHYVDQLAARGAVADQVLANLNMDMIGRLDDELVVQGIGSSTAWKGELERRNAPIGLALSPQADSYLPTDAMVFYIKGVPILSAFSGSHEDYHSPRDTPDKLNYRGLADTARLFALVTRSLATRTEPLDYVAMTDPREKGTRVGMRAYLGTIPHYADLGRPGLKLSGVTKGAPADQAGLKGDDIIMELAGRKIADIHDYTFAISALKIGEAVDVVVERDGKLITLQITPGSRE